MTQTCNRGLCRVTQLQTTHWTIWIGRFCYVILWLPYFIIGMTFGAIDGAYQWAKTWIKWTPIIWKEMH